MAAMCMDVIAQLEADAGTASGHKSKNASEALLRHDWAYRWKEILQIAGLDPLPAMASRERRLRELAETFLAAAPCP